MNSNFRFALPTVAGRGAGLGNELFSWAKAYIGSRALGLKLLHPAWGMNARPYWRYFGTSRADWALHRAMVKLLPTYVFSEDIYRKYLPASFHDAVAAFGRERNIGARNVCVVEFSGMWGGVPAVIQARDFVLESLLAARHSVDNLFRFRQKIDWTRFTVGVHVRRGDFHGAVGKNDYAAKINVSIPIDWFVNICRALRAVHRDSIQVVIFGDASEAELAPLLEVLEGDYLRMDGRNGDISDLLALSSCDLIVCSLSSYSVWAAALSSGRYIWLEPHLTDVDNRLTIWGYEPSPQLSYDLTRNHIATVKDFGNSSDFIGRGVAIGWPGDIPGELHDHVRRTVALRRPELDLIQYGSLASARTRSDP